MKNKSTERAGAVCMMLLGPCGWITGDCREHPGQQQPWLPNFLPAHLSPRRAVMTERQMVFDLSQSPPFLRHVTLDKSLTLSRPQFLLRKYEENNSYLPTKVEVRFKWRHPMRKPLCTVQA